MKARIKATGEIVEVTFLDRKTHTDENGNPIDWDAMEKHKFNMLFSEDLY